MIVKQSDLSKADLRKIYRDGLRKFGKRAAERYVEGIADAYNLIGSMPQMNPVRTEVKPPVHLHPYKGHLIIYRIGAEEVRILRVLSRHQDWQDDFYI
jgi:toxin ParE1/3/4